MKRPIALALVVLALAAACGNPNEDAEELRRVIDRSELRSRNFTMRSVSEAAAFMVKGEVEDDLRFGMILSSRVGKPLVDYVVRDDALAVRVRDQAFGAKLANVLGDPVVDAALKAGRWVTDPAGAPPILSRATGRTAGEASGDPFRDAREVLRSAAGATGSAGQVKEFSLEDIQYRSRLDPWRYPEEGSNEIRYDLIRPRLPTSEAQTGGRQADIGPSHFRKTSVFVEKGRVAEVCELIDIESHEEFIVLKQRGLDSNPYLADLMEGIAKGETTIPIVERYSVAEVNYSSKVSVDIPADAVVGKLEAFTAALERAITSGALKPKKGDAIDTSACRRASEEETD